MRSLEWSKPVFSEPAIGCPPTNTSSMPRLVTTQWISSLVEPTSEIRAPGFKNGRICVRYWALYSTGVQRKMMSHSRKGSPMPSRITSTMPSACACSSFARVRIYAMIRASGQARLMPLAMEPPISPRPIKPNVVSFISEFSCHRLLSMLSAILC